MFLFYRIFYLLFDYEISKYFRPYSFSLIAFEMLIQNNVEFFSFLGFRSLTKISFAFNFISKLMINLGIVMMFLTVIGAVSSYFIYYYRYKKLAKYFLVNMFRFPSSYGLMIIVYGLQPFFKGAIHAILYENWYYQIWGLMGLEITIFLTVLIFEFIKGNHRSKIAFKMEATYKACLIIINILILCKYRYF